MIDAAVAVVVVVAVCGSAACVSAHRASLIMMDLISTITSSSWLKTHSHHSDTRPSS